MGLLHTLAYKIDICCSSAKHTTLMSKIKDWIARNRDNVSFPHSWLITWTNNDLQNIHIKLKIE